MSYFVLFYRYFNLIVPDIQLKFVFYQMVRKQRNNKNIIVEDLYIGNTLYEDDNILKGWHEHFHNLAQWQYNYSPIVIRVIFVSLVLVYWRQSPTLTNSGIESCAVMLLIKSSR
jgi:hypothetical protein